MFKYRKGLAINHIYIYISYKYLLNISWIIYIYIYIDIHMCINCVRFCQHFFDITHLHKIHRWSNGRRSRGTQAQAFLGGIERVRVLRKLVDEHDWESLEDWIELGSAGRNLFFLWEWSHRILRPSITTKLYPDNVAGVSIPVFKMNYDASKVWQWKAHILWRGEWLMRVGYETERYLS